MSLDVIIRKKYKSYQVEKLAGETIVKGRLTKTAASTVPLSLAILPVSKGDLIASPQGTLKTQDIKVYRVEELDIPDGSKVTYKGNKYELRSSVSRADNGKFSIYIGHKLNDSN